MHKKNRVLIIAIDSAEITLIQKWTKEGQLPNLSFLIENGSFVKLKSTADLGSATVWPSFFTGTSPAKHCALGKPHLKNGTYNLSQEQYLATKLRREPFWNLLSKAGKKIAVLDVPGTFPTQNLNGIQLTSWGAHGTFWYQDSTPTNLIDEVHTLFGSYKHSCTEIVSFYDDHERMARFCNELIYNVENKGSLSRHYLDSEDWDLFITVFSESHCAGHNLWHLMDSNHPQHDKELTEKLGDTILKVYRSIDSEIGKILNNDPDSTYIIFSPEGMGPNYTGSHLLPNVLRALDDLNNHEKHDSSSSLSVNIANILHKLHELTPASRWGHHAVRKLRHDLPETLVQFLDFIKSLLPEKLWYMGKSCLMSAGNDWRWRRAFSLPSDLNGAIRINLKGREPSGIVNPGSEYQILCNELKKEFEQLINIDTGNKAVSKVILVNEQYEGENVNELPDLIVKWNLDAPIRGLKSTTIGAIYGDNSHDRVGAHTDTGFLVAYGKNINDNNNISEAHILDIAPTVLYLMGHYIPHDMDGNVILHIIDNEFKKNNTINKI